MPSCLKQELRSRWQSEADGAKKVQLLRKPTVQHAEFDPQLGMSAHNDLQAARSPADDWLDSLQPVKRLL